MKIEEYTVNPLRAYIKAERYLNDGSPSGFSNVNTTSQETRPCSAVNSFCLRQLAFHDGIQVEVIGAPHRASLAGVKTLSLLIHPDMVGHKLLNNVEATLLDDIEVAPTASGRTVCSLSDNPYFVKLAYPRCLGRLVRHLGRDKIVSACVVTRQLENVWKTGKANKRFSFLREDYGRVAFLPLRKNEIEEGDRIPAKEIKAGFYEWGVLYREFTPYPYCDRQEYLIPFFALFGNEYVPGRNELQKNQDLPLVLQLYRKQRIHKRIEDFLLEEIIFPLCDTYFDALILGGIELEAHAQNMLLSVDEDYNISRIVCRDLESAGRDATLMDYFQIPYDKVTDYKFNYLREKEEGQKYPKWQITHSFMFDFKMGEYILSPLIRKCQQYYPDIIPEKISGEIKKHNRQYVEKLPSGFFPPDWCDYGKINFEQEDRKREYIWHGNPKYR